MYESPVNLIYGEMQTQIEGDIYKAVQNVCVDVNKEELIKALSYDRNQYDKGYNEALDDAKEKFLQYGCVCVEWNKGLSKEKLVDDVLKQVMGQVVYILEKMKCNDEFATESEIK